VDFHVFENSDPSREKGSTGNRVRLFQYTAIDDVDLNKKLAAWGPPPVKLVHS
jgi:hypothetical protein